MNRTKFLAFIIVALLISNFMLIWHITKRPPHPGPGHGGPRNAIIEKLHFDEEQIKKYDVLIDEHRAVVRENDQKIMHLKNSLYALVDSSVNNAEKDSVMLALAEAQANIEKAHFRHFQDIRRLCRDEQLDEFRELMDEIASLFAPPRPPGRRMEH